LHQQNRLQFLTVGAGKNKLTCILAVKMVVVVVVVIQLEDYE